MTLHPSSQALDQALGGGGSGAGEVLSPAALASGETDDYNPTDFSESIGTLRLTPDSAGSTLTGIVGGVAQRELRIINISTTASLSFAHDSAASAAGNRFLNPDEQTVRLAPGGSLTLWHDPTTSEWRTQLPRSGEGLSPWRVTHRAAGTLPQTATEPLFTSAGGLVRIYAIFGRCTTILGAVGNQLKLIYDPTSGATDVPLTPTTLASASLPIGTWAYKRNGSLLQSDNAGAAIAISTFVSPIPESLLIEPGNISLNTILDQTGSMEWWCIWEPFDVGATLVATGATSTEYVPSLQQRTNRAAATLPQTTVQSLFTVSNGPAIVQVLGRVTTVLGASASVVRLIANPSSAGLDSNMSGLVSLSGFAAGRWVWPTGNAGDAMLVSPGTSADDVTQTSGGGGTSPNNIGVVVSEGDIRLDASDNQTGEMEWYALWIPLEKGVVVTAV